MLSTKITALLGVASACLFAGMAQAQNYITPNVIAGATQQMAINSGMVDCTALQSYYDGAGLPRGDSLDSVRKIDAWMKKRLNYRADRSGAENWNSFAPYVLQGQSGIAADCDDFTLTAMHLAICAGVPAGRLDFAGVQTRSGEKSISKMSHAFGVYTSPTGEQFVFGDTKGRPRNLTTSDKVILRVSAAEISRGMGMRWRSSLPLLDANNANVSEQSW